MQTYRLVIHRHGKLLGHFECSAAGSRDAIEDIARHFPSAAGYGLELLEAVGERRLLESDPSGVRLLCSEALFKPSDWHPGTPA